MKIARSQGVVHVAALASLFNVSEQSIRRDLSKLAQTGMLNRMHGGATLADSVANIAYRARCQMAAPAKRSIAEKAATLIPNDCALFINIGSTTEALARCLVQHRGLLVITNNINIANILMPFTGTRLVIAGGSVRREDGGIVGEMVEDAISRHKTDIAVIGVSAIDRDGALLDYDHREVRITRAIIKNSRRVMLLADAMKFSRRAPVRIGDIGDIDILVTDRPPPLPRRRGCRVVVTEE